MYFLKKMDEQVQQYFFYKEKKNETRGGLEESTVYREEIRVATIIKKQERYIIYLFDVLTPVECATFFPLHQMSKTDVWIVGDTIASDVLMRYLSELYDIIHSKDISVLMTEQVKNELYFDGESICDGNCRSLQATLDEINQWEISSTDMEEIQKHILSGAHLVKIMYEDDQIVTLAHGMKVTQDIGVLKYLVSVDECYVKNTKQLLHYFLMKAKNEGVAYICIYNTNVPLKVYESFGFQKMSINQLGQRL